MADEEMKIEESNKLKKMTNHERVVYLRSKKQNMTVELYKQLYPKGYSTLDKNS
jgi:hypothetical protein